MASKRTGGLDPRSGLVDRHAVGDDERVRRCAGGGVGGALAVDRHKVLARLVARGAGDDDAPGAATVGGAEADLPLGEPCAARGLPAAGVPSRLRRTIVPSVFEVSCAGVPFCRSPLETNI